jgi:DNA-binding NarL/FixJ family response regulator
VSDLVTVLLAHEHALFRTAIRAGLEGHHQIELVGEAADEQGLFLETDRVHPRVALIDSDLPPNGGMSACAELKAQGASIRVVMICPASDQDVLIRSLEAGADGYVNHDATLGEISTAARAVANGDAFVPPRLLGSLLKSLIERRRADNSALERVNRLSAREREVYALLVDGNDHNRIAQHLVISPATARTHVQNLLRKLEVHSRLEATALAIQHGLTDHLLAEVTRP